MEKIESLEWRAIKGHVINTCILTFMLAMLFAILAAVGMKTAEFNSLDASLRAFIFVASGFLFGGVSLGLSLIAARRAYRAHQKNLEEIPRISKRI